MWKALHNQKVPRLPQKAVPELENGMRSSKNDCSYHKTSSNLEVGRVLMHCIYTSRDVSTRMPPKRNHPVLGARMIDDVHRSFKHDSSEMNVIENSYRQTRI
jgi:hypothetical protein